MTSQARIRSWLGSLRRSLVSLLLFNRQISPWGKITLDIDGVIVRNAIADTEVAAHLVRLRQEVDEWIWSDPADALAYGERKFVSADFVMPYFEDSMYRMNVIISQLKRKKGAHGANIGIAYGFVDIILRREYGVDIVGTDVEESIPTFCGLVKASTQRRKYANICGCSRRVRDPALPGGRPPPVTDRRGAGIVGLFLPGCTRGIEVLPWRIGRDDPPIAKQSQDFVIFAEVLEHLKSPPVATLRLLADLLRPGGLLLLTTPNVARFQNIDRLLRGKNILEPFREDLAMNEDATDHVSHVREYTIEETGQLVKQAGLQIQQVIMCPLGGVMATAPLLSGLPPHLNHFTCITARKAMP